MKRVLSLLLVFVVTLSILPMFTANAANKADFNPGKIIDDTVFYNANTMDANQIQNFLNSKNPVCDWNGTQPASDWGYSNLTHAQFAERKRSGAITPQDSGFNPPPYRCLTMYTQTTPTMEAASGYCGSISAGTRSAAQIINDVSKACGVNPQVLIVLLEKEQNLVTDNWPLERQLNSATGFACPDDAACNPAFAGFFSQVYSAAKQFKIYQKNPSDYNYRAGRTNTIPWSPTASCGSSNVYIQNQATAALFIYTPYRPNQAALDNLYGTGDSCSSYGNRNFWRIFTDWFGSPSSPPATECDSKVANIVCVWSVIKTDGSQFLTSSKTELASAMYNYGWTNEGIVFYASATVQPGTVPVHRLLNNNRHYYTVDQSEYDSLKSSGNWTDEGLPFYVYPATTSTNMSHGVYELYNPTLDQYYWTTDQYKKTSLMNMGYTLKPSPFNSFSGLVSLDIPAAGRINIYRLQENTGYFYTTSLPELESVIKNGYPYDGVLTTASADSTGTAVYRLEYGGKHFYTTNPSERDSAVQSYGMIDEGVGFYIDSNSSPIYRLTNSNSDSYLYTSSIDSAMSLVNTGGWAYEDILTSNNSSSAPVYRFLNLYNNRHFYTIDINEAMRITNKGWRYETVAFYADKASGLPVYRLLQHDKHFYTTDANEKNIAISKYGYIYEGVAFYVSPATTDTPIYRLQGGNDEYFYTSSSTERDSAIGKYGYHNEGIGFYLPSGS